MRNKTLAFSLLLLILALTQPAVYFTGYAEASSYSSITMLLVGAISILGGATLEWLLWLANPICLFAMYCLYKGELYKSLLISLISLTIAASFMLWQEIQVSESGRNAPISHLAAGYYLWLASIAVLFFGSGIQAYKLARPTR